MTAKSITGSDESVAPIAAQSERRNYRADVQGLRAIAVIMVVAFHAGLPVRGGFTGVDVFFVISGFVITEMLERQLRIGGKLSFRQFYARRIRRLLPAMALLVTVVAVAAMLIESPFTSSESPTGAQYETARTGIGAIFIVANAVIYRTPGGVNFMAQADQNPFLHTWSLSVEEQFYLVFPALLALAWFLGRRTSAGRWVTGALLGTVGLVSLALCIVLSLGLINVTAGRNPEDLAFFSSPTRAWEFAAGALVALALPSFVRFSKTPMVLMSVLGSCLLLASAFLITWQMQFPGYLALVPVAGTALLIVGGSHAGADSALSVGLATRPMVSIGDLSYSWYLWHWPIIVFALILMPDIGWFLPVVALASLAPAWLSYRLVESPIRRNPQFRGRRMALLTATCIAIPTIFCLLLYTGQKSFWWQPAIASMAAQIEPTHAALCDRSAIPSELPSGFCEWNSTATGSPIVLLGDSNAEQFTAAAIVTGTALNRPVVLAALSGCPFVVVDVAVDGAFREDCQPFREKTISWLKSTPGATVLVASAGDLYVNGTWAVLTPPGTNTSAVSEAEKATVYGRGLTEALGLLRATGANINLIKTIPHFTGWWPDQCPTALLLASTASCGEAVPLDQLMLQQAAVSQTESTAAKVAGVPTLDLSSRLCPQGQCRTNLDNSWHYRDDLHITVDESVRLAPAFIDYLKARMG